MVQHWSNDIQNVEIQWIITKTFGNQEKWFIILAAVSKEFAESLFLFYRYRAEVMLYA